MGCGASKEALPHSGGYGCGNVPEEEEPSTSYSHHNETPETPASRVQHAVSPPVTPKYYSELLDAFLTHDWGEKQENHKKVKVINGILKEAGLKTWFDEERMKGNIQQKMQEGIDHSACVV
eukprot:1411902-Pyramimonas_sp.AAC.1